MDIQYIQKLILQNDYAVERAILAIYHRQTADEKVSGITRHTNHRGFNGPDSRIGTYYAKWIIKGNRLTGRHLLNARMMIFKYAKQLLKVALEKKAAEKAAADSTESGSAMV